MNRVHKTRWSESAQCWQAVPETAKAAGKRAVKSASGGVLASVVMGLALTGGAGAQSPPATTQLPTGGTVARGNATISQTATAQAAAMTVNQSSQRAVINWDSFNLGSAASIHFAQPNAQAVTLNRVNDSNPSQIFGRITSNGQVFLSNPNGVYFSPTASVDVGALVATTHGISDDQFMAGKYLFERNGATGKVVNEGRISAALGGYVALLAPEVQNAGVVVARAGTVALAAGEAISLQVQGGGLAGITTTPSTIATLIENKLAVQAPDGQIILSAVALNKLQAGVIKNSGSLEANSLVSKGGKIFLEGDDITLASTSQIEAKGPTGGGTVLVGGDWQGSGDMRQATQVTMAAGATIDASATDKGDGGKVVLWSDVHNANSHTSIAGTVVAQGHGEQTKGGQIETSGSKLDIADSATIRMGGAGASGGRWLLDPVDFTIAATGGNITGAALGSSITAGNTVEILNTSGTTGTLGNINVNNNVSWNNTGVLKLTASGGVTGSGNFNMGVAGNGGLIFNQAGASTYSGVISGVGKFTKTGIGTLTIGNVNTYSLGTLVEQGTLSPSVLNAFFSTSRITVMSGASLDLNGINVARPITLNGTGYNATGALKNSSVTAASVTGAAASITLESDTTIIGNGSITINTPSQVIGNNYSLILGGTGTSSSFSGTAVLNIGTGTITKVGTGTWSIQSSNTFTGDVYVNEGKLTAFMASASSTPLGSSVGSTTVRSGASLSFAGGANGFTNTVAEPLNLNGFGVNDATGALDNSQNNGATLNYTGSITLSGTTRINVTRAANTLIIKSTLNNDVYDIVKTGLGTLNLQGTPTMTTVRSVKTSYEFVSASDASSCTSACSSVYGSTPAISYLIYDTAGALTTDTTITGTATFNGAPTNTSAAGSYSLTYSSGLSSTTHALFPKTSAVTWTVTKAPLTVTPTIDQSKIYGSLDPVLSYSTSTLAGADTTIAGLSGALSRLAGEAASNYTYSVANLSATNYTFTLAPSAGQFSITPRPITLTATPLNKIYGNADLTLAATITAGSLGSTTVSDTLADVTGTLTRAAGENVGSYSVALGTGIKAANYAITFDANNQAFSITKAPLTVTANNAIKTYGDANPTLSATVSGFVNGETWATSGVSGAGSTTATTATAVGNATITAGVGTLAASNYDFSNLVNGTLTINKAPLTVTANNAIKTYGDANPTLSATVSGFVNGESLATSGVSGAGSASTTATTATAVGNATITAGVGTLAASNYDFSNLVNGTLTIQAAKAADSEAVLVVQKVVKEVAPLAAPVVNSPVISVTTNPPVALVVPVPPGPSPEISIAPQSPVVAELPPPPPVVATLVPSSSPANVDNPDNPDDKDRPATNVGPRLAAATNLQGEQVAYLRPAEASGPSVPPVTTIRAETAAPPASTALVAPALPQAPVQASTSAPATASVQAPTASSEAPRPALTVSSVIAPASAPSGTGVLAITILRGNNAQPISAGVAFEQNADTVSLRAADAPPLPPSSERLVFNDRLTTFMVANSNGTMVEFQGSLVNNRMVIVAPSAAAKLVAQSDMNTVLAAAVTSLGRESRVMLAQLDGVVIDLR
ncbi:FhaB Large exoproteins involved in heme utilization or adhesion [Burkholderiaceae bacterium]